MDEYLVQSVEICSVETTSGAHSIFAEVYDMLHISQTHVSENHHFCAKKT